MDKELNTVRNDEGNVVGKVEFVTCAHWRDDGKLCITVQDFGEFGEGRLILDEIRIKAVIGTLQGALVRHGMGLPPHPDDELIDYWKRNSSDVLLRPRSKENL